MIGTADWIANGGIGATRGFRWGTLTARLGFLYDTSSSSAIDYGGYAVEYLKRVSPHLAVLLGHRVLEGDEGAQVTELHWSPSPRVTVRLGNQLGNVSSALSATTNSIDYQPGVGVVVRFGER